MSSTIRISLAQITSGENPTENLELIETHTRAAARVWVSMSSRFSVGFSPLVIWARLMRIVELTV